MATALIENELRDRDRDRDHDRDRDPDPDRDRDRETASTTATNVDMARSLYVLAACNHSLLVPLSLLAGNRSLLVKLFLKGPCKKWVHIISQRVIAYLRYYLRRL